MISYQKSHTAKNGKVGGQIWLAVPNPNVFVSKVLVKAAYCLFTALDTSR